MKQKRRTDIYIAKLRKQSTHMKYKGTLVVVKDCRRALRFYQDLFGFELIRDNDGNMELSGGLYLEAVSGYGVCQSADDSQLGTAGCSFL